MQSKEHSQRRQTAQVELDVFSQQPARAKGQQERQSRHLSPDTARRSFPRSYPFQIVQLAVTLLALTWRSLEGTGFHELFRFLPGSTGCRSDYRDLDSKILSAAHR